MTIWVWGGAARVGATYAIGPRWFLDLAYTFARSEEFKIKNAASFPTATARSRAAESPSSTPASRSPTNP
jgi:hypothetical protein